MKAFNPFIILIYCILPFSAFAQYSINGNFPPLAGQQVKLVGFQGFGIYTIDSAKVAEQGEFSLNYLDKDRGMGYLAAEDNKAYFVVLANENIQIKGEVFSMPESIVTVSGKENQQFVKYAGEHRKREQALSAWVFLQKIYQGDSLFSLQKQAQQAIDKEMLRIKREDLDFLNHIDTNTYISWYLPIRSLVSSVSTIAQYRPYEIPATINTFRKLDYTDERLYKSGLLKETIESHFWLIENSGYSSDSMDIEMNTSIDYIIENLTVDVSKFNEITGFIFKLFEKHSLFRASEYLALKVLNEEGCTLNNDVASQLESYRAMKKGNTAPCFDFNGKVFAPGYTSADSPQKLSDISTDYTLVIFGASWCPACPQELLQIAGLYPKWKKNGLEVVFVSLDKDDEIFKKFVSPFPFISICDYQKWESPVVKKYHVFATPTYFLLDNKREILLRPNSARQIDSWVDWYLVRGNEQIGTQ